MCQDDAGGIFTLGGGDAMSKNVIISKKKSDVPAEENYVCFTCGKLISGDHVYIKTKRNSELHIHYECIPWKEQKNEKIDA